MNIFFSVDRAKIEKRISNKGEDAPVVNKQGFMIVCDGMGATGMTEHAVNGENYTSAYLGSRATSEAAERFLNKNYERLTDAFGDAGSIGKIVTELGDSIRKDLLYRVRKDNLVLTVHGKSFRLLPTTFAAVIYKIYKTKVEATVLCAGDSEILWWNRDGLFKLSAEDGESENLSMAECKVANCISADDDFCIAFSCYELSRRGVLLATTDGFTDPISNFEKEGYLIEWLGKSDNISEEKAHLLSEEIGCRLDDIGFTKRDDCSMAGVIIGFSADDELKSELRERYGSELIKNYIRPYMELKQQYTETERELCEAKHKLNIKKDNIIRLVTDEILNYLENHKDAEILYADPLFRNLTDCDTVSREIRNANYKIDCERKEKQDMCNSEEAVLRDRYIEFLKKLCYEYGSVRFSDEIISATKEYYEKKKILSEYSEIINCDLAALKTKHLSVEKNCSSGVLDEIFEITKRLTANIEKAKNDCQLYHKNKEKVDEYFDYRNEEIERFYREDICNGFAILKRIHVFSPLKIKRKNSFKVICENMLDCYGKIEELKPQITDVYVQNCKNAAHKKIVAAFCEKIAEEIFYKDRFQEYISEERLHQKEIPELLRYISLQKQLKELIKQRNAVSESYNREYGKYLSGLSVHGSVLFRKEVNLYEDN